MKRLLLTVLIAAITIGMLGGCAGGVKTYTDAGRSIDIGVNQQFIIALGSNPTTGYSWQANYDETTLELIGGQSTYEPGKEAKEGMVGTGGVEYFRFKALKSGQTEVTLVYKRPWEETTPQDETKVFTINIQ